ncbi:hypothetical protein Tco_1244466 [Tanacetum coccineum]
MLAPNPSSSYNGRPSFANPKYLKKAQSEKPCMYKIPYKKDDLVNIFAPNHEETVTLKQDSRSKLHKKTIKKYDYTYQNSLNEIFTQETLASLDQLYYAIEARKKMWRKSFVKYKPNIAKKNISFLSTQASLSKSRQAFNTVTHNINHFKTIVDLAWEKRMDNAWQQPTIQEITVLVKNLLNPLGIKSRDDAFAFETALKKEVFEDLEYIQSLEKELDEIQSDKNKFSNEYDLLLQECVSKDIMSFILHSLADIDEQTEL